MYRAAVTFALTTGIGSDGTRIKHLIHATKEALQALAAVLNAIEAGRRWPSAARQVLATAIPKKVGGSRLIGVATMVYRLWAKVRYGHCQATMETRIARPYLDAAPGRGAARAALAAAFRGEAAVAERKVAATTMVDTSRFYEAVRPADVAAGAKMFGLPQCIFILNLHLYMGPRRIKIGSTCSAPVFPSRTVLPGCAWATVHVRMILIRPVDKFIEKLKDRIDGWVVHVALSLYVDDWALTATGDFDGVAFLHPLLTRSLLLWIARCLKMRVATEKLTCVASSAHLRDTLRPLLRDDGVPVELTGDLLGVDYTAGGRLYGRNKGKVTAKRNKKHFKRMPRVRWLGRLGGKARDVVHSGLAAGIRFGEEVRGLPPSTSRKLRIAYGKVTWVQAAGASLTARLALGGAHYRDIDPMTSAQTKRSWPCCH